MIMKVFWTVMVLDGIAAIILWKLSERGTHGLLILAYWAVLILIGIMAAIFLLLRSDGWRTAALVVLLLPSAGLVLTAVGSAAKTIQEESQFSGGAYFRGPAFALAQAMVKHDNELVKQLIPAAGDLNQPHGRGVTLWQFGVLQTYDNEQSIEMLRILIAGGADPKRDDSANSLQVGMGRGPGLTRFLLEAGLNPNVLDHERRPAWWRALQPGEDDANTELLRMVLDHGADLRLRAPDGRGPVGYAIAGNYWYAACLMIERGADWKQEQLRGGSVAELLAWEVMRRDEYPIPVPAMMRKVAGQLKGEPIPEPAARPKGVMSIPELLRLASFEKLDETRAQVARLAQQPNWARRVEAFFVEGDGAYRNHVALILSLKPEALPDDVQEQCWAVVRAQIAWFDGNGKASKDPRGWLLRETAVIAAGLASVPGPARDRHRADFIGLRDRIEACRKENDPAAPQLADLRKVDWRAGE